MAGIASTHAFASSGALLGLSRQSAGLALARHGPRPSPRPSLRSVGAVRMEAKVTTKEIDGQVEFMGVDGNGNPVTLSLAAREKLYLDAVTSFYIDGSKLISDEDYEQLRNDLAFEGSNVGMMSRDEIKFMVAASRYADGKPIMSDSEFDNLRRKLKAANSKAVIHEMPVCKIDSMTCKADLTKDTTKNFVLYLPAFIVSSVVWSEFAALAWGLTDPVTSLVLNSPFIAALTYVITNFLLFQQPLVTVTKCPRCQTEQPIYFGDVLFVDGGKSNEVVKTKCINKACQAELKAFKDRMMCETDYGQAPPPPPKQA